MAYYALLDQNDIVVQVISGVNENETQTEPDGTVVGGSTQAWETYYASLAWFSGLSCKRTSYNGNIRKQYAGIGFTYDPIHDVFIAPQPFPSWILDSNFDWQAPKPRPSGFDWYWDESKLDWIYVAPQS